MDVKHHVHISEESEFRSCVKVEVAVLGSPSLIVRTVSVDVIAKLNFDSSFKQRSEAVLKLRHPWVHRP